MAEEIPSEEQGEYGASSAAEADPSADSWEPSTQEGADYANYEYNPNITAWGTTLYPYTAQSEGELSFNEGDLIGIIEDLPDGWSRGDVNGVEGVYPTNYVQRSEEPTEAEQVPHQDEEQQRARREKRDKMKEQMRELKSELVNQSKVRQQIEKEMRELTEVKQKLTKENREARATMSDKASILMDLVKLQYSIDMHTEALSDLQAPSIVSLDAITQFSAELSKEAKSIPLLTPHATKLSARTKEMKVAADHYRAVTEDGEKLLKEIYPELDSLVRALQRGTLK